MLRTSHFEGDLVHLSPNKVLFRINFNLSERSELENQLEKKLLVLPQYLKITQNIALEIFNFGIFYQYCPNQSDLSGNTVWPKALGFQKLAKIEHFFAFLINFCLLKMGSSLRSRFLWKEGKCLWIMMRWIEFFGSLRRTIGSLVKTVFYKWGAHD